MANTGRRLAKKSRERRYNKLLNTFIAVVLGLIVLIGGSILLGNNDEEASVEPQPDTGSEEASGNEEQEAVPEKEETSDAAGDETSQAEDSGEDNSSDEEQTDENGEEQNGEEASAGEGDDVTEQYSDNPNVVSAVKGAWEPIGTEQEGAHEATEYNKGSQEWKEMEQAAAYGAGLDPNNMITWRIENNGGPQRSHAVITPKDQSAIYDVELVWVDGQGWKPEVVKQLKENPWK
ncbi:YrrS family protein [Bacillus marinisedimentorum]|uniref:YrrS family protein n=1 Tax=Bacillus marinisedimentorum TaxID=1821260 RepID=UPI000872251C|nr:YrrS family protein [Bacillus marinisedimentorum]